MKRREKLIGTAIVLGVFLFFICAGLMAITSWLDSPH
jgi:hypothetical protein